MNPLFNASGRPSSLPSEDRPRRRAMMVILGTIVAASLAGSITTALASGLGATASAAATSVTSVSSCGALAALTFTYTVSSGNVTQVIVGNIPASCQNGTATMYLGLQTNTSVAYSSTGTSISSSSVTFGSLSVPIASITNVDVAVVGK